METGPRNIYEWFKQNLTEVEYMVVQDIHTGLGSFGYDTLLFNDHDPELHEYLDHVEVVTDSSGTSYVAKGGFESYFSQIFPNARVSCFTQEFGTKSSILVLKALIEENYYHHFFEEILPIDHWSKQNVLHAFYPHDSLQWKESIIQRGQIVFFSCLSYLSNIQ